MNLKSIRWRLPLSYAGISLLAALALGLVLIAILRGYYGAQEREYLQGNAKWISGIAAQLIQAETPTSVLKDQATNWSFVLQARVQILDERGQTIADSGVPEARQVLMVSKDAFFQSVTNTIEITPSIGQPSGALFIYTTKLPSAGQIVSVPGGCTKDLVAQGACPPVIMQSGSSVETGTIPVTDTVKQQIAATGGPVGIVMRLSTSPFGFKLDGAAAVPARRSDQVVTLPVQDDAGRELGQVVLSDGPAAGQVIVDNVLRGWAVAGAVAVILAAGVGWLVSRQMTAPILALAKATQRMAEGDLAARAAVHTWDEFGQLSQSFNEMASRVEETVTALRNFVADAAHELHTPLTALRTNLELAGDERHPAQQAHFIADALTQAARLEATVNNLLDLSRLEAQARAHEPVDLTALIGEAGELYASRAEQAGLQFAVEQPAGPLVVSGDRALLLGAVKNLLDNALKFTPPGGAITLRLAAAQAGVTLSVADTGIGIPPEDLPRMFQRFHRGRNAAAYPGSGLGLAIVKAITVAHGGEVALENAADGGTICTLSLPRKVLDA